MNKSVRKLCLTLVLSVSLCLGLSLSFKNQTGANSLAKQGDRAGENQVAGIGQSNGWYKRDGKTYYLEDGKFASGFRRIDNHIYFFNSDGSIHYDWLRYKDNYYYFDPNNEGRMVTGVKYIHGLYRWFYSDGRAYHGLKTIDGKTYFFTIYGAKKKGWLTTANGTVFYLDPDTGEIQPGMRKIKDNWYYFNKYGVMQRGLQTIDGKTYLFAWKTGQRLTGLVKYTGKYHYFNQYGVKLIGSQKVYDRRTKTTNWMYFYKNGGYHSGYMVGNGNVDYYDENGHWRVFNQPEHMVKYIDVSQSNFFYHIVNAVSQAQLKYYKKLTIKPYKGEFYQGQSFFDAMLTSSFFNRTIAHGRNMSNYYLQGNYDGTFTFTFTYYEKDYMKFCYAHNYMNKFANSLKGKSVYEKIRLTHDKVINMAFYSNKVIAEYNRTGIYSGNLTTDRNGVNIWSIASPIIDNEAVCESYANFVLSVLKKAGVEVRYIMGYTNQGYHGWNLVKIGGKWYHLDPTFDDWGPNYPPQRRYFLVSDYFMKEDGRTWTENLYPKAISGTYK